MYDVLIGIFLFLFAGVMASEKNVVWRKRDWAAFYCLVGVAAFCCTYGIVTMLFRG